VVLEAIAAGTSTSSSQSSTQGLVKTGRRPWTFHLMGWRRTPREMAPKPVEAGVDRDVVPLAYQLMRRLEVDPAGGQLARTGVPESFAKSAQHTHVGCYAAFAPGGLGEHHRFARLAGTAGALALAHQDIGDHEAVVRVGRLQPVPHKLWVHLGRRRRLGSRRSRRPIGTQAAMADGERPRAALQSTLRDDRAQQRRDRPSCVDSLVACHDSRIGHRGLRPFDLADVLGEQPISARGRRASSPFV
jgi:hypothetical protein